MTFVSLTRLRLRSVRFLPGFARQTFRAVRQVKNAEGFRGGSLLVDRKWTFWTMTSWDSQDSMRRYMLDGPHRVAMPHLLHWCDEASVAHWDAADDMLPSWPEADRRMRESGRASKVLYPSRHHADLSFRAPRVGFPASLRPNAG